MMMGRGQPCIIYSGPHPLSLLILTMTNVTESYEHLLPPSWKAQITEWLAEDTPSFDYGGYVVGEVEREAYLFGKGKEAAVLAGSPFFTEIFTQLGCQSVEDSLD
jgi:hypothetical protein